VAVAAAAAAAVVVQKVVAAAAAVVVVLMPQVAVQLLANAPFPTRPLQLLHLLPQSNLLLIKLPNKVSLPPSTLTPNYPPTLMAMQISSRSMAT